MGPFYIAIIVAFLVLTYVADYFLVKKFDEYKDENRSNEEQERQWDETSKRIDKRLEEMKAIELKPMDDEIRLQKENKRESDD